MNARCDNNGNGDLRGGPAPVLGKERSRRQAIKPTEREGCDERWHREESRQEGEVARHSDNQPNERGMTKGGEAINGGRQGAEWRHDERERLRRREM